MKNKNVVISVEKNSIAAEIGISVGDKLLFINDYEINDYLDYKYHINDDYIEMAFITEDGEEYVCEIDKDYDEDIGIVFSNALMDNAKSCHNKCVFCFIDQMPENMRETLYFKDDDSRLSFLQGNYITMTNMTDSDVDRIIFYHLSPINISVHTTDMLLREKMLKNKNAKNLMNYIKKLYDANIEMNFQIVLCKNYNDKEHLYKTITDLGEFLPVAKSLSVVPAGVTKFRENLPFLKSFTTEEALEVIKTVYELQKHFYNKSKTNFVYCSDEFFINANLNLPDVSYYDDFLQYENGVGMVSLYKNEFDNILNGVTTEKSIKKEFSIATGVLAMPLFLYVKEALENKFDNLKINLYCVKNIFFGETITVSGLLTGVDIINSLKDENLGETLLLPDSLLRSDTDILLDDIKISDIENELNVKILTLDNNPKNLFDYIYGGKII